MAQQVHINNIQYTFKGFNQYRSIIDHFILSENMEMLIIKEYYATDSLDNLSDHIPLYMYRLTVILRNLHMIIMLHSKEKPIWNIATNNDIQL